MTLDELLEWYWVRMGNEWLPEQEGVAATVRLEVDEAAQALDLEEWSWPLRNAITNLFALEVVFPGDDEEQLRKEWPVTLLKEAYGEVGVRAWQVISELYLAGEKEPWRIWRDPHYAEAKAALYNLLHETNEISGQTSNFEVDLSGGGLI
jgi:hypothetical protein